MKVKATQEVIVELDEETEKAIAISVIESKFDITKDSYIKDGGLYHKIIFKHPREWYDEVFIREASDLDRCALKILEELKN